MNIFVLFVLPLVIDITATNIQSAVETINKIQQILIDYTQCRKQETYKVMVTYYRTVVLSVLQPVL